MIVGKNWLEDQDALIYAKDQQLETMMYGAWISSVNRWESDLSSVVKPQYISINTMASMVEEVLVYRASF